MTKRMLIDTTHEEETRVALVSGNKLIDYDFETTVRKQLKGNIYLVKVTRVEPSLQAAFVDYGGNRHGFLPFPEIHPDYYKIPVSDREAILEEEKAWADALAEKEAEEAKRLKKAKKEAEAEDEDEPIAKTITLEDGTEVLVDEDGEIIEQNVEMVDSAGELTDDEDDSSDDGDEELAESEIVDEDEDGFPRRPTSIKRRYKIQEVIKRNQIMLIQIGKEERGNKGAAVTSYISLPGRYCVLMPNSPRGGGVSRKVSNIKDRQKLKKILKDLNVPEGMSVIMRTAGVAKTKVEIKRDLDYLLRLWNNIRELTMKSTAPSVIHEEGDLVKRAIRDLYKQDVDEVIVSGEHGFNRAKSFMQTLMPTHVKNIKEYDNKELPLFFRYKVENQIDEIHQVEVQLKSGGYLVINPTEALVSIDINSGKATKTRHIEETAVKTNLEAAEEIARQLKLRDLGGLVVIDFIDMEETRNNRAVERKMKESMQGDRARIQLSRISAFGLMEMSRQRLRPSLVEQNFTVCEHCEGTGLVRTLETAALIVLRAIAEEGLRGRASEIMVKVPTDIIIYIFNHKRETLIDIETRNEMKVILEPDNSLIRPAFVIETVQANKNFKNKKPYKKEHNNNKNNNTNTNNNAKPDTDEDGNDNSYKKRNNKRRNNKYKKPDADDNNQVQENNNNNNAQPDAGNKKSPAPKGNKPVNKNSDNIVDNKANTIPENKPDTVSEDVAPKKKRGRPAKKKIEDNVQDSKDVKVKEAEQDNTKSETVAEEPKKKRGRPAKKKVEDIKDTKPVEKTVAKKDKEVQVIEIKSEPAPAPKAKVKPKPVKEEPKEPKDPEKVKKGWWQKITS